MAKKYDGETLICRTRYDGKNVTGRVSLSSESIKVRLVGFEDFVYFKSEDGIPLQLEDNQFCTVTPGSTSPGSTATAVLGTHFLDISVRQAIIGFRPWKSDDLVKELQFSFSDANGLFNAPDIQKAISAANFERLPETNIIEVKSAGATVSVSFGYNIDWHTENFQVAEVWGNVTFDDAKTTSELSSFIGVLRTFFTMAAGIEVWLSDYWIVPKEDRDQPIIGGGRAPAQFQLLWPNGQEARPVDYSNFNPNKVLSCWGDSDRKVTSDCLKFWIDNWTEWRHAFSGLLVAIREGEIFQPSRIVNACKWLESTPGADQIKLDSSSDIDAITTAAITKARELGLMIDDRISGAMVRLGTESRNSLFKRLVSLVILKDDPALKARFLKDLHKAYHVRGDFAHSKFDHSSDEQFGEYVRVTKAVEALAFLLLFRQLPLSQGHNWPNGPNNFTEYFLEL
ncbi:hypothetical protein [Cypionkella sp.]|uniref:hypothetical protein n=1 Tax=Cypionkella sp. TaxID=2811411 RepID=UPI002ABCF535|nr:hypothetical protein [Cypionkella sp.]MDZ4394846.1 hypothetical protein [Cypionkella sp.]